MNMIVRIIIGLIAGYIVGIVLAAVVAFVLDFEDAARFVAVGCALVGALLGPRVFRRLDLNAG